MKLRNKVRMGGAGRSSSSHIQKCSRDSKLFVPRTVQRLCSSVAVTPSACLFICPCILLVSVSSRNVVYISFLERHFYRGRSEWGRCLSSLHVPEGSSLSPIEFHRSRQTLIVLLCGTVICRWFRTLL